MARTPKKPRRVSTLTHGGAKRRNAPTAEAQPFMADEDRAPVRVALERRNRDLDPQLVWRGKDEQDAADLVVQAAPLFIQEKVHPKALVDDLLREAKRRRDEAAEDAPDLFADFNGLPEGADRTEFYAHDANWSNRMILGDALQVMGSLAEREGLRGKVQCIYVDPPYGIRFNSNFQWSTTSRDVKDGKADHVTREPEQVKAFRDTWRDGIHSYLAYLRDRLTAARELLAESGSVFVQIGDENVHRVRSVMDEVFGEENFVTEILFKKTGSHSDATLGSSHDYILWYARDFTLLKIRPLTNKADLPSIGDPNYVHLQFGDYTRRRMTSDERHRVIVLPSGAAVFRHGPITGMGPSESDRPIEYQGRIFRPEKNRHWSTTRDGIIRAIRAGRVGATGNFLSYILFWNETPGRLGNIWDDTQSGGFVQDRLYVVQTTTKVIQRCILMTTDPGDLVLDPTCGSGTTATVAEQWGRRWITIDTSRVALALARARIMGARYPWYLLADSPEGQRKEAELTGRAPAETSTGGDVRQGFVYERVPHVTLKSIANNAEIDAIWEKWRETLEPLRSRLSVASGRLPDGGGDDRLPATGDRQLPHRPLEEWEIPRERPADWPPEADAPFAEFWEARIARQREIDASIAARADTEYLYDKPYADPSRVRVAGPFTVESLAPHRMLAVDENDDVFHSLADGKLSYGEAPGFAAMVLEHLATAGVQQAHREDRVAFSSLSPWPGKYVCAEGRYAEGGGEGVERRAGVFVGPEFGTVARPDLVAAAREASEAGFDVLVACAFSYDAHATEFEKLGGFPVLKARMNADLHMAGDLKNTGKGNLFVVFGEPDIEVASEQWLVDSRGNRVAPYDIFTLVSGVDGLAEVNGLDRDRLCADAALSRRREVWDYLADAAGRGLDTGEHRGRTGATPDGGVSSVAWRCAGLPGGTRNLRDLVRKAASDRSGGFGELVERLRRDQQDVARADAVSIHPPLTTIHWSQVTIHGVDVFHPNSGEVRSHGPDGIACWFVDTDYDEESFFVRHAYFLGANDPYKALKTTLKAEIDPEAWSTLNSDTSRPFDRPTSGRIAVKVINHLGDEAMKVFRV